MTDHGADLLVRAAAVHTLVPGALRDLTPTHTILGGRVVHGG
jgi:hypothetical protein